jgi:hypothetical protein
MRRSAHDANNTRKKCDKDSRNCKVADRMCVANVRDTNVELLAWCWRHVVDGGIVQPKRSAKGPNTDASGGTSGCQESHGQADGEAVAR